jgi:predicted GH43/DUF377 family glycosyl hydrolase
MSVVKKGKSFFGVYRAIGAPDVMREPHQISIIGLGESKDKTHFENCVPFITPTEEWDKYGCEDPRITYFEGKYYIFYTALSKYPFEASGIKAAVAISKDLKKVDAKYLVTPFNAKAMTLFPERVNGKILVILSVNTDLPPTKIAVAELSKIEDLWNPNFWENWYKEIDKHTLSFSRVDQDHIEVGAVSIKTKEGWLFVYSHIQNYFPGGRNLPRIFGIEAALLDLKNPQKIIAQTKGPMLVPRESYELVGHVPEIVFPSSALLEKDTLYIYYGAADMTVCVAHVNLTDLLNTILEDKNSKWRFERFSKNPILSKDDSHPWEAQATFNPAAIMLGTGKNKKIHILYRAMSNDNTSTVGYATSVDGFNIKEREVIPIYTPRESFEQKKVSGGNSGCEDPRLTQIGKNLYMCYTAFDGVGPPKVAITSISAKNFLSRKWNWEKPTIITPQSLDDKDTCIFPEKINGKYFILHRVASEVCGDYLKSLNFKGEIVKKCIRIIGPRINSWDSAKVGICTPPIKTKYGWLLLYHGISTHSHTYRVGALLLDIKDPTTVLARTSDPIFDPATDYEKNGIVNNVVFPCGMVEKDGTLFMYYGGADKVVGVATMPMKSLLTALTRDIKKKK